MLRIYAITSEPLSARTMIFNEPDSLLIPISKCRCAILQQTLKQLTKEEQQKLLIRAIQAPEATAIVEQLITAEIEYKNPEILFEAMKADARLHTREQGKQKFFPNEKTLMLLQKGFTVDQFHLLYAAENIRDIHMVALLLKQPSITVEMIKICLARIEKISLQNKGPVSIPSIRAIQLNYNPIIEVLKKGLRELEEKNEEGARNNFRPF